MSFRDEPINETFSGSFLVPDYYSRFKCKGSDCRNTCCHGWKVTISRKEYYILHGLSCNKTLRAKIDRSFIPLSYPTKDRYAEIVHNENHDCPLLLENGHCSLHAHFGEKILPTVCRYYPRGPRIDYINESSCTNSCERTLELLFEDLNPIHFIQKELTFQMVFPKSTVKEDDKSIYLKVRSFCFDILSNRHISLPRRIQEVGKVLYALDKDKMVILDEIDLSTTHYPINILETLAVLISLSTWFIENSESLSPLFQKSVALFENQNIEQIYRQQVENFELHYPEYEIYYEKMLINNLFFREFPFQEYTKNFIEEYKALCGKYLIIRFLGITLTNEFSKIEDLIDIMAKVFRVIAHTKFEQTIVAILNNQGIDTYQDLGKLIQF